MYKTIYNKCCYGNTRAIQDAAVYFFSGDEETNSVQMKYKRKSETLLSFFKTFLIHTGNFVNFRLSLTITSKSPHTVCYHGLSNENVVSEYGLSNNNVVSEYGLSHENVVSEYGLSNENVVSEYGLSNENVVSEYGLS